MKTYPTIKGDLMDISGMNKAKVLAALYNSAIATGGKAALFIEAKPMTEAEAQAILDSGQTEFQYLKGRLMKIDLSGNELNTRLYNRDNGENAAENALRELI